MILQEHTRALKGEDWATNPDARLDPEAIAQVHLPLCTMPRAILTLDSCQAYMYLVNQNRSAWTSELDCTCAFPDVSDVRHLMENTVRPAHENW